MNGCPVFVGRAEELSRLAQALDDGGLVLVSGEAGIGKSRLVRELAGHALQQKYVVLWARPEALAEAAPYSLILDLLEDVRTHANPSKRTDVEDLEANLQNSPSKPPRAIAALLRGFISSLGHRTLLIVEDLHLADEISQAVLAHLVRGSRDEGVVVVATFRTEETTAINRLLDLLARDRLASELKLRPLQPSEVEAMLLAISPEISNEEINKINELGEGVPFLVEELAASRGSASSVPDSISRAVQARFSRLSEVEVRVLTVAALMHGVVDPGVLAVAAGIAEDDLPPALFEGMKAGFLVERNSRLEFRHALTKEAVAASMPAVERARFHEALALAYESFYQGSLEQHSFAIARHYSLAGRHALASPYFLSAAKRSLDAGALDEAMVAYEESLRTAEGILNRAAARAGLGEVLVRVRRLADAEQQLREAAREFALGGDRESASRCLLRVAALRLPRGGRETLDVLDEAEQLLGSEEAVWHRARIEIDRSYFVVRTLEEFERAEPLVERAIDLSRQSGDSALLAEALEGLAWLQHFQGDYKGAHDSGAQACELATRDGTPETILKTHSNQALRLAMEGACLDAVALLRKARALAAGSAFTPSIDQMLAWVHWKLGAPNEAYRYCARAEAASSDVTFARLIKTWAMVEQGETQAARSSLDAWWAETQSGVPALAELDYVDPSTPASFALRAELLLSAAEGTESERLLQAGTALYSSLQSSSGEAVLLVGVLLAQYRLRFEKDAPETHRLIAELAEICDDRQPYWSALVQEVQAAAIVDQDQGRAIGAWSEALGLLRDAGNVSDRARILRRLVGTGTHSHEQENLAELRQMLELCASVGAVSEARQLEAQMRDLGLRPRAGRPKGSTKRERGLTIREEEVVALVAAGASNAEIASQLFLSSRTVEAHIANAQRRLKVSGRAGLAAWAAKTGLI